MGAIAALWSYQDDGGHVGTMCRRDESRELGNSFDFEFSKLTALTTMNYDWRIFSRKLCSLTKRLNGSALGQRRFERPYSVNRVWQEIGNLKGLRRYTKSGRCIEKHLLL
jgi:hypothetical protein